MIKKCPNIDERTDGAVEVIDVKLNNRKTKKLVIKKKEKRILQKRNLSKRSKRKIK